jgi:hypothetical protein
MDDKKFAIIDDAGNEIECEIIKLIPNHENEEEPYIIYTDFNVENGYKMLCGQLIEKDGIYTINKIKEDYIIDYLKEELSDEMIAQLQIFKENNNE